MLCSEKDKEFILKLNSGKFETEIDEDGDFAISIKQESDWSTDGGYTFEYVRNTFCIGRDDAKRLIDELQDYVRQDK